MCVYTGLVGLKNRLQGILALRNHILYLVFSIPGNHSCVLSLARKSTFAAWVPAGGPSIRRSGPIAPELFLYFHVLDYYC